MAYLPPAFSLSTDVRTNGKQGAENPDAQYPNIRG